MKETHYDNQFNANEWSIISSLVVGALVVWFLPKRFTKKTAGVYLLCGVFFGFFFDHTLSVLPVSFYDLNDNSKFQVMDFLSHWMYAAYSYVFFYLYDLLRVTPRLSLVYILAWALLSVGAEKLSSSTGIFHYQHGYNIFYSFAVYLLVLSVWVIFYYVIRTRGETQF
ncbi:hypothetical protein AAC03nite_29480 [Alicyclobacillus acidoterrestris]|uniref:hypothetical protein n=1 Tax=Alicyclobacillus suci TaxID=2816080 RepID=UPI001194A6C6|nr:hypothetical protein [Alicyclobacillus suci]GEO27163.1 hypothetical protein AAC03nite_29480 [Alicyclobacillus acidoterrestris]